MYDTVDRPAGPLTAPCLIANASRIEHERNRLEVKPVIMQALSDILPVSFGWVLDYALVTIDHLTVGQHPADAIALGFAFFKLSFDERADWPVAFFAVSFWVAAVAQGDGFCTTEGLWDYMVLMGGDFATLKAFSHGREFTMGKGNGGKGIESFC